MSERRQLWFTSPVIGTGAWDDPFRPSLADVPRTEGDRLDRFTYQDGLAVSAVEMNDPAPVYKASGTTLNTTRPPVPSEYLVPSDRLAAG